MEFSKKSWQGYSLLLLAQLMVGVGIVGCKSLLQTIPAVIILAIRFTIGSTFLLLVHLAVSDQKFRPLKQLTRLDWGFIISQALCAGAFFNILLLLGLKYTNANVAGIITSALPAIVVIFSIIFLKERVTISTLLCVGFAVIGLIIIKFHSLQFGSRYQIYGDILILASLIPEATYYILSKLRPNKLPVFLVSALMNGINVLPFLLFLFLRHQSLLMQIAPEQYILLFIVGISSALFYVFWFSGCNHVSSSSAGLITAFMPIATLIIAYLFLGESNSQYHRHFSYQGNWQ
ncbi:DMT family transporter [Coxiella burnetii]|uniref:DMT family transporter n=2 Tax=Coxiella burnetii TaxID=777 RepID=UPI0021E89459|nr:DMT family transporter [Coxiella burnetii]UYK69914.1 DMT family transporter [Coxiella burnetii]